MTRVLVTLVVLAFVVGFALLTISVFASEGITASSVVYGAISVLVILLLGIGIVGSLRNPPD